MTTEAWKDFRRTSENADDADTQQYGQPSNVIRSPDSRKFGLSPIPDKTYRVWFYAWSLTHKTCSFYGDTVVFPEMYTSVLTS